MLEEISKYIFTSKYARYNELLKRRETWEEAVDRVEKMHLDKFSDLDEHYLSEIKWAFDFVRNKRVVPSMRSMQFGGQAVEAHNARIYNCAVRHIDSLRSFSEVFYLLLCGCGVGLGLTPKYLNRLPNLVGTNNRTGTVITYVVEDSIEGWADSLEALLQCYFVNTPYSGRKIVFDYSRIRRKGSKLKTGGGKAPGYSGLKNAHAKIKRLLDNIIEKQHQERLFSINAYDIIMHSADAVLSGGVRRSATSVMFDKNDELMMNAKTGDWIEKNPQRARSNNSVLLLRDKIDFEEFNQIFEQTKQWGEPGFVFSETEDVLYNPCFEISMIPVTDDGVCGVQFCNLSSINGAMITSAIDFYQCAEAASIIGTLQASYTSFPYLSNAARDITESEALLGVSITGMLDNADINLNTDVQAIGADIVVDTNERWAAILGINPAARATAIKPEGTSSLALKTMASGIHAAHAHEMFRRIQANKEDNVYKFFKMMNPHMCEESVWSANGTDDVITFPVKNPDTAMVKADLDALKHLNIVRDTQIHWVQKGSSKYNKKPIHHNVSCTVIVKESEWVDVSSYLFDHRRDFAAVSFIADTGDKDFQQAPNEAIVTVEDKEKFKYLMDNFVPMDYTLLFEDDDGTSLMQEMSCSGPTGCELR